LGEGVVAAVLLMVGGLKALQTASITAALPFSFVMIIMMWGLAKSLEQECMLPLVQGQSKLKSS
jgi:choline/glycine/proline betaine transport protein